MYQPDFQNLRKALLRQGPLDKVPFWELAADAEIVSAIIEEPLVPPSNAESLERYMRQTLKFQLKTGCDCLPAVVGIPLQILSSALSSEDTSEENNRGKRLWVNEHNGLIQDWEDFEKFPWPKASDINYAFVETASRIVPDGMKVTLHTTGILENVQWLMGYETMAMALYDEPELVGAMFEKIGELMVGIYETAAQYDNVELFAMGDDMGFKAATLFAPEVLRKYVFPLQKRCVQAAHSKGGIFLLHSCGNLELIMDDLIDDVGIDAKHSYEDVILPVEEAKARYGKRVAIVGGVDMDLMARGTEEEVRARTRNVLEKCSVGGGYVMGTGNSVANYVPLRNFLAMMDETNRFNAR